MSDLPTPTTTVAPVKSSLTSKTNITALLLAIFGLLTAFGALPAGFDTAGFVGGVVTLGAGAVALFRTFSTAILRPAVR